MNIHEFYIRIIEKQKEIIEKGNLLIQKEILLKDNKDKIDKLNVTLKEYEEELDDIEDMHYDQVYRKKVGEEIIWYLIFTMVVLAIGFPFISTMSDKMFYIYVILVVSGFLLRNAYDNRTRDKKLSLMFNLKLESDMEYQELKKLVDLKEQELDKLVSECYDIKNEIEVIKEMIINMKNELDLMLSDVKTKCSEYVENKGKKRVRKIND